MELDVSPRVRELLARKIDSFEKLELVVALDAAPATTSSIDIMAERLGYSRQALREAALDLRAASLVNMSGDGEVQLLPPSDRDREALAELVAAYERDRMVVIKALGELALNKIRSMASNVFADAFLIRRKNGGS